MASDLKQKTETVSAIGSKPLASEPKINLSQIISDVGMKIYAESVHNNANEYLNKVEQIKALHLGEDETQKRLSGLAEKSPYLSMMSPLVRQQQSNLQRESDPVYKQLKSEAAMDRLKESLAINDLNTIRNSVNSVDEFKTKGSQLRKDTEETLKRGASSEFNREFGARFEYGISSIPTMASLRRGVTSDKELLNSVIRGSTNEFMEEVRKTGRQSPTIEELSKHFDPLITKAIETSQGLGEVRRSLIDLLSNQPDIKLAEEAFKKYPGFFDQSEITKNIPAAIKSKTEALGQNALPLTLIDTEVRGFNQVGRPSLHISSNLVTSDSDRRVKSFLDTRALNYISPEELDKKIATDPEYNKNYYLISNIQQAFKEDFKVNPGDALIKRGIINPEAWVKIQGLSMDEKGVPIIDKARFYTSVKNRAKDILFYKNQVFQGTEFIDMIFDQEEASLIATAISRMEPQEAWNFTSGLLAEINKGNQNLALNEKPISALNNMKRVIQDDPLLVNGLGMAESAPLEGFQTYVTLKHSELKNSKDFAALQSIATAGVTRLIGGNANRVPDSTRYAAVNYLMANHIMTQGILLNEDKSFVTEKINNYQVGNSTILLFKNTDKKLNQALKKQVFKYQGKNQNLHTLVHSGKVMLENAPYSMNKFYLRIPRDNIDAMANIGNYYIDPETKKRHEIFIDPEPLEAEKGIFDFFKK